jgi:tetratricopeptide (TPR) repeat protein
MASFQQRLRQLDALIEQQNWHDATPKALALFEAKPTTPGVLEKAVVVLREQGAWQQLSELLLKARNRYGLWPSGSDLQLGQALLEQGEPSQACPLLEQALEESDCQAWAHHFLGKALRQLDQLEPALEHQRQAAELLPTFAWAPFEAAQLLLSLQRPGEALIELHEGRRRAGSAGEPAIEALWHELQPTAALLRVDVLLEQGDVAAAMGQLRPLLSSRGDDAAVQKRLTAVLALQQPPAPSGDLSPQEQELEAIKSELRSIELLLDALEAQSKTTSASRAALAR